MALHLLIQYCNDSRPARQAEYDFCALQNLNHPQIAAVHDLLEPQTRVPEAIASHPKHREHRIDHWLTYQNAFDYAARQLPGHTVALANLDIFLDPQSPWDSVEKVVETGVVLCQSRTEYDPAGPAYKDEGLNRLAFANSQDAWIFRSPLVVSDADFRLGTLGCDNAIADRIRRSGRLPVNMADRFRVMHFDRARGKTFGNQNAVHQAERGQSAGEYPEEVGQYLLPNFDQVKSVDDLLKTFNASDLDRYRVLCDVVSHFVKIRNR